MKRFGGLATAVCLSALGCVNAGTDGSQDMAVSGTGDLATNGPPADMAGAPAMEDLRDPPPPDGNYTPPASCTIGAKCTNSGDPGLCKGGVCAGCSDGTDDAKCVTAYGAGYKCVGGGCILASCAKNSDCTSGKICDLDTKMCVACTGNSDCSSTQWCKSGACTATLTTGDIVVDAVECGAGTFLTGECCADSATCDGVHHTLAPATVGAVTCTKLSATAADVYVNPDASAEGTGTMGCPYKTIHKALLAMKALPNGYPSTAVTIHTTGTIDAGDSTYWPQSVPTNVTIDGDNTWKTGTADRTVINIPAGIGGFMFKMAGPGGLKNVNVISKNTAPNYLKFGVYVTDTANSMDDSKAIVIIHSNVKGFNNGVWVDAGGYAWLQRNVTLWQGMTGLAATGGWTKVTNTYSTDNGSKTFFKDNAGHGIRATGSGVLVINGVNIDGTEAEKSIKSTGNQKSGLYVSSIMLENSITDFSATSNVGNGVYLDATAALKARKCVFSSNGGSGVYVDGSDPAIGSVAKNFNFGTDATTDPGKNRFLNNTVSGVFRAVPDLTNSQGYTFSSDPATGNIFFARGNYWEIKDSGAFKNCETTALVLSNCGTMGTSCHVVHGEDTTANHNWIGISQCTYR